MSITVNRKNIENLIKGDNPSSEKDTSARSKERLYKISQESAILRQQNEREMILNKARRREQYLAKKREEYERLQAEEQSRLDAMRADEAKAKLQEISAQKAAFKQENGGRVINNLSKLGAYLGGFTGASQAGLQEAKNKAKQNLAALDELDAKEEKYRKVYQQKKPDEEIAKLDSDTIALLDTINEGEAATDIYFAEKRANELTGAIAVNGDAYTYKTNARDAAIQKLEERGIDNWKELAEYRQYQKNAQEAERQKEESQKLADEHPIAAFAAARAANFESGIGIIENIKALDNVTDLGADTNSPYYLLARATRDIDARNMENHDAVVDVPIFGDVDLYDFGYNLASSTADNALRAVAAGGNSAVAGALMGSQVFSHGFLDAKEKGYSDNKAFGMAFTQAAIEGATEKWSLDAILKSPKTFFGGIARGFAAEGSEEIASNWANRVADAFVNGNNAEIKQAYNAYIRDGYSHNQALSAVIVDMVGEDLEAGLIGGLSGAGMSTAVHAPASIRQTIEDKAVGQSLRAQGKVGDLAQNILSENANIESAFSADKTLQKLAKQGENLSSRKAGKMARLAASSTSETALTSTVAEMLADAGMDENAAVSAAPAVLKSIRGEKLSIEQRALLKDSEAAQSVISSLKDTKSAQAVLAKAEEENLFLKAKLYAKPSMNTVSTADVQQAKAKIDGNIGVKSDKITSIVSSSADGVWYRTNSGEVVRGTAVEFENDGVAQMFADLANLDNVNAANVALVGYSGQNVPMYTAAVQRVVRAASTGQSLNSLLAVNRQTVGVLGEQLTKAIYNAACKIPVMVKNYTKADLDAVRKTGGVLKNYTQKLTAREDATVRVIDEIGKKYGVAVVVCDTIDGGQSNGFYNEAENVVYIGLDAHGGLYLSALGHELFHHLKAVNPESADELHDFVIDKLKKSEKYDYKAELKKRRKLYGTDKSVRYLEEEMVADSMFSVFDAQTVETLVQEHRTLAEKIKDFLDDVLSWIEKTARNWSREAYALSEDEKTLSEIRDKFLSALDETAKSVAKGKSIGDTNATEKIKFSINNNFAKEYDSWDKRTPLLHFEIGRTSRALQGIGIEDKKIVWDSAKIIKIKSKHFEMTDEIIKQVPNILENPIIIMQSKTVNKRITLFGEVYANYNHPVLVALELYPSRNNIAIDEIKIASAYQKNNAQALINSSTILYVDRNKKRIDRWSKFTRLQLPVNNVSVNSNTTVPQNGTSVNTHSMQNSSEDAQDGEVRKSVKDSQGNTLSEEQQKFFKDSAVRDDDGNLLVVYHGTDAEFTVFDKKKSKYSNLYGRGFYFTDSDSHAKQYGNAAKYYLNIKNPLKTGTRHITKDQVLRLLQSIENDGEEYDLYNYGEGATAETVLNTVWGKDDFSILQDISATAVGDFVETVSLFNSVNGTDYDGIIPKSEFVAFYPNQVKRTDNLSPTDSEDIRFSLKSAVEETDELIAVHNMTEDELRKTVSLGGFPMPSIAIQNSAKPNNSYGEISVLFRKESVDPEQNAANKVYSGDRYTQIYPTQKPFKTAQAALMAMQKRQKPYYDNMDSLKAAMTEELKSIGEIKARADTLSKIDAVPDRYFELEDLYFDLFERLSAYAPKQKTAEDTARKFLYLAAKNGADFEAIQQAKNKLGMEAVPVSMEVEVLSLLHGIQELPISYFEAKPERVVDFSEVAAVVVPNTVSEELKNAIYDKGIDVIEYIADDKTSRLQAVNSVDGVRFSFKNTSTGMANENLLPYSRELQTLIRQKGGYIVDSAQALKDVVNLAFDNPQAKGTAYFGILDTEVLSKIEKSIPNLPKAFNGVLFKKNKDYSVAATLDSIRHITDEKHLSRIDVLDYLDRLADTIVEFDSVVYDTYYDRMGNANKGILFKKRFNDGVFVSFNVVSNNKRSLNLVTVYMDSYNYKKRKSAETLLMQKTSAHTPEAGVGQTSIDSISENGENVNIRKSLKDTVRTQKDLLEENRQLRKTVDLLKQEFKLTAGHKLNAAQMETLSKRILRQTHSSYDLQTLTENLTAVFESVANGNAENAVSFDDTVRAMSDIAMAVLEESSVKNTEAYDAYKDMRDYFRTTPFALSETAKQEIPDYDAFRKSNFGRMRISDSGSSLDSIWGEISELWPEFFPQDAHEAEQALLISEALEAVRPIYENPYAYDAEEAAYDLAMQMYDAYFDIQEKHTFADKADMRRKMELTKLRNGFDRRISQMRTESKAKYKADLAEVRRTYQDRIRAEKQAKWDKVKEVQQVNAYRRERDRRKRIEQDSKVNLRRRIIKNTKELNSLLVNPTDQKHIPQGLQGAVLEFCKVMTSDTSVFTEARIENLANAYKAIANVQDGVESDLLGSYDADIADMLTELQKAFNDNGGKKRLSELSVSELRVVDTVVQHLKHIVKNENKLFFANRKATIDQMGNAAIRELNAKGVKKVLSALDIKSLESWKTLLFTHNLKPIYFFKKIGGVMQELYEELQRGEDDAQRSFEKQRAFFVKTAKENDYFTWAKEEKSFVTESGAEFTLTADQMLAIYATYNREQGRAHLLKGGICFEGNTRKIKEKTKLGVSAKYTVKESRSIPLTEKDLANIIGALTEEQRAYADKMVQYLSKDVASLGNEISLSLYGYKKFNEPLYFPIVSKSNYLNTKQTTAQDDTRIKHASFTHKTVPNADNPIVISGFTDVWARHCTDMATYHAFALRLEDFNRIWNYKVRTDETDLSPRDSVKSSIENAFGAEANKYIHTLLVDVNGGATVQTDGTDNLIAKFKRSAVFMSLSVAIQQPSAIARAFAMVDPKYFVRMPQKGTYEEAKRYSAVAGLKERGYFDTGMAQSTAQQLVAKEYDGVFQAARNGTLSDAVDALKEKGKGVLTDTKYRDDLMGWLPGKMDEWTWSQIWLAVKAETAAKYRLQGDALLKKTGKRFDEVIRYTQVYDSVFSRSGNMRKKDSLYKMATAFMAEPTTSLNMVMDAFSQGRTGNRKYAARAMAALVSSYILNAALVSLVYAGRDDDEDETFLEKYLISFLDNLTQNLNPINAIPFVKDFWNLAQGYSVERADMSLFKDLVDAFKTTLNEKKSFNEKISALAGAVGNFFGIPIRNVMRDFSIIGNVKNTLQNGRETTLGGVWNGFLDEHFGGLYGKIKKRAGFAPKNEYEQLYDAIMNGDSQLRQTLWNNLNASGKSDKDIQSGLRSVLKKDSRITEAAQAQLNGDSETYAEIVEEFKKRGFAQSTIVGAVNSAETEIKKESGILSEQEEDDSELAYRVSVYAVSDAVVNLDAGDTREAQTIVSDIYDSKKEKYVSEGKSNDEAAKSARSSVKSALTKEYKTRYINGTATERKQIEQSLTEITVDVKPLYDAEEIRDWLN